MSGDMFRAATGGAVVNPSVEEATEAPIYAVDPVAAVAWVRTPSW